MAGYFVTKKMVIFLVFTFAACLLIVGLSVGLSGQSPESSAVTDIKTTAKTEPTTTPSPTECNGVWCNLRIPSDVYEPTQYFLTLEPDMEAEKDNTYTGSVVITVDVKKETSVFTIHVKPDELKITKTDVEGHKIDEVFDYKPNEFWVIRTKDSVKPGTVNISLEFQGYLTHNIVGFYKSTYKVGDVVHPLVTSKFQPSDARKAFPCFDEPQLKANFTVTLIYRKTVKKLPGYYALSNMPPDGPATDLGGGRWSQKFQESVKMSSYLVCFIVCDFDSILKKDGAKRDFTVYAPKSTISQAKYAAEIGPKILDFYVKYFDIDYPLPKTDMIAIPDFPSGAMEHWGLITYRMTSLLYDQNVASMSEKRRVATVVAHELAHMWFGNLVTMDWWDDLWLNEGFASYVEYLGTNAAEPGWRIMDQFVALDMSGVMELDSTDASHPIIAEVESPDQVTEIFDSITYQKGSSVIRMLNSVMGKEDFSTGVTNYMKEKLFDSVKTKELWEALTKQTKSKIDVGKLMSSWTKKSNYPVVTAKVDSSGTKTKLKLEQAVFLLNPGEEKDREGDTLWEIPIFHVTRGDSSSKKTPDVMNSKSMDLELSRKISADNATDFYKLNAGQFGFFRVNYDADNWAALSTALNDSVDVLGAVDRAGLLDDVFNLARGGRVEYRVALGLLEYLNKEPAYVPWSVVSSNLFYITHTYDGPYYGKWLRFVAGKSAAMLDEIGFEKKADEDPANAFTRPVLINLACYHGDQNCLTNAKALFTKWLEDPDKNPVEPNIRSMVYRYGMLDVTGPQWNQVYDRYMKANVPQEKKKLLRALAETRTPWIIQRYIDYANSRDKGVRSQDYYSVMQYISGNPVGHRMVWDYIKSHWDEIVARFTINDRYLGRLVQRVISDFKTEFYLQDVKNFFAKYPKAGAGERARAQGLAAIEDNIAWKKKFEEKFTKWLEELKLNS